MNSKVREQHGARQLLAENVRILRAARNVTQQELAEMASMDRGYLLDIESARRRASVDTLDKLSRAFGVAPHELLMPRDSSAR